MGVIRTKGAQLFEVPPPEVVAACAARAEEAEAAERARRAARNLADAGIPAEFSGVGIEDADPAVRLWAELAAKGHGRWLLLRGANGRGKTRQACAALRWIAQFKPVRFATMQDILDEAGPKSKLAVLDRYAGMPVLLIDDFGKEVHRDWTLPTMFQVLDRRWRGRLPTIVTTNMDSDTMRMHMTWAGDTTMADSIISRLAAASVHTVDGPDWRVLNARAEDEVRGPL